MTSPKSTTQIETPAALPTEDKALTPNVSQEIAPVRAPRSAPSAEAPAGALEDEVEVTLAHFWGEHRPGDKIAVSIDVAGQLRRAGFVAA